MQAIADALRGPLFLKEEIERERQVVIGEYDRNESNPFFKLQAELGKQLYPGQWSRKNVIGDRRRDSDGHAGENARRSRRSTTCLTTRCSSLRATSSPDSVFSLAEKTYGDWARGADPFAR